MKPEETGLATQIDEQLHCGCASPLPDAVYFAAVISELKRLGDRSLRWEDVCYMF